MEKRSQVDLQQQRSPKKKIRNLNDDVNTMITAPSTETKTTEQKPTNPNEPELRSAADDQKSFEFQIRSEVKKEPTPRSVKNEESKKF